MLRHPAAMVSFAIAALFTLPLVIDFFAGRAGNWHDVLLHLQFQSGGRRTMFKSFLCYASYFAGLNDPTPFNRLNDTSHLPFVRGAWLIGAWLLTLALSTWWLFKPRPSSASESIRFGRWLVGFWLFGSVLTLIWGVRQDGGFTYFNSHFNHSLVHIIAMIGVLALTHVLPRSSSTFGVLLTTAALPLLAIAEPHYPETDSRATEVEVRTNGLLQADPKPSSPKLITWEVPNEDWYESVTLARAFQRRGLEFYVTPQWAFMFGSGVVFKNQNDVLANGGLSSWHVVRRKQAPANAHVLNREYAVCFRTPPVERSLPLALDFTRPGERPHVLYGLSETEQNGTWTIGSVFALAFAAPGAGTDIVLDIEGHGFVATPHPRHQRVTVSVNGQRVGEAHFGPDVCRQHIRIAAAAWNAASVRTVVFEFPDAASPALTGRSPDRRVLGVYLRGITFRQADR